MEVVLCQQKKRVLCPQNIYIQYFLSFRIYLLDMTHFKTLFLMIYFLTVFFFLQFMNVSFNVFLWAIVVKTKFNISSNNFVILF